ncbi:hypothetical protein EXA21_16865 [Vibrio cincinnatiensis]|uniref:uracil-DNA glycosylase family protein n=1 Tax=Vibrio cincinnatiensis TaxID=675 RepID=UPI001EE0A120|nr:uracil-DNA glycosylase family protein [Vibrio cincinnatiensis]MCG3761092.1 hypothetical protein [Vibrio cincinnatiensis]MCG3764417.1 hypothetical protein [Vibrio cincinnatiensis]
MLHDLLRDIRQCRVCEPALPLGANPVIQAHEAARILIIGQAPGIRVHQSSIPWNDPSGDLPPLWHQSVLAQLPNIQMTLLIGQYAQNYYLKDKPATLTETVRQWQRWAPHYLPLPHPSPRNTLWLKKNPWWLCCLNRWN